MGDAIMKAMYAFSGDPITYGHIDIITRAANAFDEVVVGVGVHPLKNYTFSLEERMAMAEKALAALPNVEVASVQGMLVDFAYEHDAGVIVKGVRDSQDFFYERVLHQVGESQNLGIDTFFLPAKPELAHISSTAVKAIQQEQGMIHEYVPLHVKQCLEQKLSGQYIIGVTGEIAAGKSYVCDRFEELGKQKSIEVHNIDVDRIVHGILEELGEPSYRKIRRQIIDEFDVGLPNGAIDRKLFGEILFNDREQLERYNQIMSKPVLVRLRRETYGKKGLLLLNTALIAEARMTYLCNNNVIILDADKESQERRLKGRGHTDEEIAVRLDSQYCFQKKKGCVEEAIRKDSQGKLWTLENSDGSNPEGIGEVFDTVVGELGAR